MKKNFTALFLTFATSFCCNVFAYTLFGTVNNTDGQAISNAKVHLTVSGNETFTDNQGKFVLSGEENGSDAIHFNSKIPGNFSLNGSILNYSQSNGSPLQIKIFDFVGNQIFSETLQGQGSLDLSQTVKSKGNYLARVKMGSAQETIRFTSDGNKSSVMAFASHAKVLKKSLAETLEVTADGYDTLRVALTNLDTSLTLILSKTFKEQTYAFGYALKNSPTPSKGCGVTSKLQEVGSNPNAKKYSLNSAGLNREYWVTLPKNYDNKKPYKILFAMHCMGSNAEDFTYHTPDQDHPSPYYGQQELDKNNEFIFVAPRGDTDGMPWRTSDNKDHIFFDELLTLLEENYCIDTSRVFVTGFSFGSMVTNSLAQAFQHRIRAVAVYAVADWNIYIPQNAGKPIAWMDVHGTQDGLCSYDRVDSSVDRILANNGPDGTDARGEKAEKYPGYGPHVCYDFKNVDPRFPVKLCTWNGGHQWTAYDEGNWQNTWVPKEVYNFFNQF